MAQTSRQVIVFVAKEVAAVALFTVVAGGLLDIVSHLFYQPGGQMHGRPASPSTAILAAVVVGVLLGAVRYLRPRVFALLQIAFGVALAFKTAASDMSPSPVMNALFLLGSAFIIGRGLGDAIPTRHET